MKRVIVIGGGAAGLAAAYKVRRAADEGHDVDVLLVEKDRLGGKIATRIVEHDGERFVVDGGPDCFLGEKPAVHRIARSTGIFDDELPTDDSRKKTLILSRGRLFEMPDGVMMFAPTKFVPFATTGLFSWPGKIRMAMDLLIPKKVVPEGELNDETLEDFVVRRMGRECLDRLAEPLVGGVHASDPANMSLAATFPRLLDMEQKFGSLMLGFLDSRKKVEAMKKKNPPKPGEKPKTFFVSFLGGMQQLTDSMADKIGAERIRVGSGVERIERSADGGWDVVLADGTRETADAVVLATETFAAEPLVRPIDADIANALSGIPTSSSATVSIAFDESQVGVDMNAFGILCPLVENRPLLAATFSSTKWPGRAPAGKVMFRGFVGGPRNQEILERSDEELIEIVLGELRSVVGVSPDAKPLFSRVFRWNRGMPQYTLGHLDRVQQIEEHSAQISGLALAGGGYRGVGVPNCIESGERAVTKVLVDLGIELAEDRPAS
jgi:oxygen-dependent protoporphyrinogen oxidase